MADLLREEMGIDAFSMDGDDSELGEAWMERRRAKPELKPANRLVWTPSR